MSGRAYSAYWDEEEDLRKVYTVIRQQGGFGRRSNDPPCNVHFNSRKENDNARKALRDKYLNCSDANRFARNCPRSFMNTSNIIRPNCGKGTERKVESRWRRWQQRLQLWLKERGMKRSQN